MKKEFGNLTRPQGRKVLEHLNLYREEVESIDPEEINPEKFVELVTDHYKYFHSSYIEIVSLFLALLGWKEKVQEIAKTDDPQESWLNFLGNEFVEGSPDLEDKTFNQEEQQFLVTLVFLLMANIESISRYNLSLKEIFIKIKNGDVDWILNLVTIDRSMVAHPIIAKIISYAQFTGDESFFNLLAKAITRTKPARPDHKYDDFRYMLEVISEAGELKSTQVEDLLAFDLELYPSESDHSLSALKKMITKRRKNKEGTETAI